MYRIPNGKQYIPALLLLFLLFCLALPAAAHYLSVDANLLNVRSGPGTVNAVQNRAPRNTILTLMEEQGLWSRVVLPDGSRGWVSTSLTSPFVPRSYATVDVPLLNVRGGPGTGSRILCQLSNNSSVPVLGEQNNWLNVIRPGGGQAWIAGWFTERSDCLGYTSVSSTRRNFRSGPSTGFPIMDRLTRGEKLAVIGKEGRWLRVVLKNGVTGWVHGDYTTWHGSADKSAPAPEKPPVQPAPPVSAYDTDLNSYVQEVISGYKGYYPYLLNNDYANYNGVTENLYYGGRILAKAHPSGNRASHCSGITFEIFFKAMQARNSKLGLSKDDFNGMSYNELHDFLLIWYVANGNKRTNNIEVAVEKYGLGRRIASFEAAKAGDFMDISRRNGTGHTVVFQNWVRNSSGAIIGLRYWSSQSNGIGFNTEYFDTSGLGNVYFNQVYIARVLPVHQYR